MLNEENVERFRRIYKFLQYRDYIKTKRELVALMNRYGANTSSAKVGSIIEGNQKATRTEMVKVIEKVCLKEFKIKPEDIYNEAEALNQLQNRIDRLIAEREELKESNARSVQKIKEIETPNPDKIHEYYYELFEQSKSELPEPDQKKIEEFLNGIVKNLSVIKAYHELHEIKNT